MFKYIVLVLAICLSSAFARIGDSLEQIKSWHKTEPIVVNKNEDGFISYRFDENEMVDTYLFSKDNHSVMELYYAKDDEACPVEYIAKMAQTYSEEWEELPLEIPGAIAIIAKDESTVIVVGGGKAAGFDRENTVTIIGREWMDYCLKKIQKNSPKDLKKNKAKAKNLIEV